MRGYLSAFNGICAYVGQNTVKISTLFTRKEAGSKGISDVAYQNIHLFLDIIIIDSSQTATVQLKLRSPGIISC